jgi:hypothetical protein
MDVIESLHAHSFPNQVNDGMTIVFILVWILVFQKNVVLLLFEFFFDWP